MNSKAICSNCGKAGAQSRCGPCKVDDARSVWYCDAECQKANWKEHKKVCLSIAKNKEIHDYLSIGRPVETRRDMKKILQQSRTCLCCNEPTKADLNCNRCKSALYCSVDCQRKDWPRHKPKCDAMVQLERNVIKQNDMSNLNNMLKEWKELSTYAFILMVCAALSKKQIREQPPSNVVTVEIEFNWNFRTFLPVEEPEAVPVR